ncbi:DegV family protein [Neisseria chenwenguii]|uniref:EDD domain protein n=1 Tax=Neisseria chenwenguii TaxID=1853278 RepID=A0A220S1L1_9NEIS|nr:DegV family protein [Neisseria chenwenguii]ASK27293.1 EDD domain protein [Neisseria chenwenguii]ROV57032.1 DegV family EDD domain-containing protein [Neisseria chenwenguii]
MPGSYASYRCAVLATSSSSLTEMTDRDSLIQILPLGVKTGWSELADGVEISNWEYCLWRKNHLDEPTATTPPPQQLMRNTFQYLHKQGYRAAIVITLSEILSDTAEVVRNLAQEMPELKIHVVDSGICCMPEGFFALEAQRLLDAGKSPLETVACLERLKPGSNIIFGLTSLKPLSLSGTLTRLGASFSDWLGLRTTLRFSDGRLTRLGSVSDDGEMFKDITANVKKLMADKPAEDFVISGLYSGDSAFYRRFAGFFRQETGLDLGKGLPVSAAVAVHVGISGVGVGLVEKAAG